MSAFPPPKGAGICALVALGTLGLGFVSCSIAHGATISTYGPYAAQTYEACGDQVIPLAAAVVIHGGWDTQGTWADNAAVNAVCAMLKARHIAGFAIDYRLASAAGQGWPAPWMDGQLMIRTLRASKGNGGMGFKNVGVIGLSAGGYDALGIGWAHETIQWAPTDPMHESVLHPLQSSVPNWIVAVSPFSDLNAPGLNPRAVGYITAGIAPTDARLPLATVLAVASPITLLRRDIPPTFIVHGTNDHVVPVQQSQSLDAEISYLGAQGTVLFTDGGHVFAGYASKTDRDQMMSAFGDFISAQALRP